MTPTAEELRSLRLQIEDLQASLEAIRGGGVDALLVGDTDHQVLYTLTSADRPYRTIVEEMGEGAATTTESGSLLYVNRQLCQLAGRPSADLLGRPADHLVVGEDRAVLQSLLSVGPGQTTRAELRLSSDGEATPVPVLASVTGLDLDGVLVRCLVMTDLSDQLRAQDLLTQAARESAAQVVELELANQRLTDSNNELAQFAYVTSHDLSEPLRTVSAFADLLSRRYAGQLDAEADEFIAYITSGVARMQQLIDDLLTYSRVETRGGALVEVDANAVVSGVLADLAGRITEVDATVVVEPLPTVLADRTQLAQVFANLIRNSLMFVAPGVTPRVHVSAAASGRHWQFTVADNGIGIPPAYRKQVFGMFKRLHTREEYPGTGIGLAIVQKVIRRSGGQVWIADHDGPGTHIAFTLPRPDGDPHE